MQAATCFAPVALAEIDEAAARRLRASADPEMAMAVLDDLSGRDWPDNVREAVGAAHRALKRALKGRESIYTAELAAVCASRSAAVDERAWDFAIAALDGVLGVGRRADPIETGVIEQRAAAVVATA